MLKTDPCTALKVLRIILMNGFNFFSDSTITMSVEIGRYYTNSATIHPLTLFLVQC